MEGVQGGFWEVRSFEGSECERIPSWKGRISRKPLLVTYVDAESKKRLRQGILSGKRQQFLAIEPAKSNFTSRAHCTIEMTIPHLQTPAGLGTL